MKKIDIHYLLKASGSSFAAIARCLGVTGSAVSQVADNDAEEQRKSPRIEKMIAAVIGLPLHEVFPTRWNPDGTRIKDRTWIKARSAYCMARDLDQLRASAKQLQETKRAA